MLDSRRHGGQIAIARPTTGPDSREGQLQAASRDYTPFKATCSQPFELWALAITFHKADTKRSSALSMMNHGNHCRALARPRLPACTIFGLRGHSGDDARRRARLPAAALRGIQRRTRRRA